MDLFEYVKVSFGTDEAAWKKVSNTDKSRNFFMMNRFLSINYPLQVCVLSHLRVDVPSVANYWHRQLSRLFGSTPGWIYTKTKKSSEITKKLNLPSEAMIKWWCNKEMIGRKDFDQAVKFFGEEYLSEIRELEKILKSQGYFSE
jgi:hypothetical protein